MNSSYILANNLRIHYLRWDSGEGRRPVLLLHGLAANARIWELAGPQLSALGWTCFAPDARGHGLTDKPDGDYGFETFRRDLLSLIDALNLERPLLVGHSWGAALALDYAAQYPVGPRAPAGVVLVDGGVFQLDDDQPGTTWEETRRRLMPPRLGGTPAGVFLSRMEAWTGQWSTDERLPQILLANFEVSADETIWPRLTFERHMQILRAMWEFETYERLSRLRCPVLAILALPPDPAPTGDHPSLQARQRGAERAASACPEMQIHWMAGTIHDIPLHRPEALAEMIASFAGQLE